MNRVELNTVSLDGGAIIKGRAAGASELFIIPADGVLPADGKENKIYLIPNSGSEGNLFDEWVFANGAWEKVGTTDFVVDQELNPESTNAVSGKAVAEAIASAITSTLNTEV